MLKRVTRIVEKTASLMSQAAGLVMIGIIGLITIAVAMRKLGIYPIQGAEEISELGFALLIFLSLAYCWIEKGHAVLDLVTKHLPPRLAILPEILSALCGIILFSVIIKQLWWRAFVFLEKGQTTEMLGIPVFPTMFIVVFGSVVFCLAMALTLIKDIAYVTRKELI